MAITWRNEVHLEKGKKVGLNFGEKNARVFFVDAIHTMMFIYVCVHEYCINIRYDSAYKYV